MPRFTPWQALALQEAICRAGGAASCVRLTVMAMAVLGFAAPHLLAIRDSVYVAPHSLPGIDANAVGGVQPNPVFGFPLAVGALAVGLFWGLPTGAAVGYPLAALYRRRRCRALLAELDALTIPQRKRVLFPLCNIGGDPGVVVDRLVAELRLDRHSTEVSASAAPEGRGNETTAA